MEDFFDFEDIKAKVFLLNDGDTKNMAMVTDEHLMLLRNGRKRLYLLNRIKSLHTSVKKSLLPLFVGGIFAPFALLSYFANMFHPMVHLVSTLLGMLLFYIGWTGRHALIVTLATGDEENVYLPAISKNVKAFISYVNGTLKRDRTDLSGMIFFREGQPGLFNDEEPGDNDFPKFGFTYQQVLKRKEIHKKMIAVDPLKAGVEIKLEFDPKTNEMRPMIALGLDRKSVLKIYPGDFF